MSHNMYLTNVKTRERVDVFSVDKFKEILKRCPYTRFTDEGLTLHSACDEVWVAYRGRNMEDLIELILSSLASS